MKQIAIYLVVVISVSTPGICSADGVVIDKVYNPYVQPLEQEIEWRLVNAWDSDKSDQLQRLGYGRSLSERWFVEGYVIGDNPSDGTMALEGWELESKWQLTEQGEYAADWGVLVELERESSLDLWEFAGTLLVEKEWGRFSGRANFSAIYEWGEGLASESETRLALQGRYRLSPKFEPAVELFSGQRSKGIGPAALGSIRLGGRRQMLWEAGIIFAINDESPDETLHLSLEFEF